MDIRKYKKKFNLSSDDVVEIIKPIYPKFSRSPLSMVQKGTYGVVLAPKAVEALEKAHPHKSNRKKSCQLTVRITPELYKVVEFIRKEQGITTQEMLERCLRWYCNAALAIKEVTKVEE